MIYKLTIACVICLIIFSTPVSSKSSDLNIDFYYNDKLITDSDSPETPKPFLKIGEPFKLKFEVTCYKRNSLSTMLNSIGNSDFDIIEGPTLTLGTATHGNIEANETRVFEWTVAPNEEWAGGSAPINFYYQMIDLDSKRTISKGEFTAAYVTISDEYYDAPITNPESNQQSSTESPSTPAFTLLSACAAIAIVVLYRKY